MKVYEIMLTNKRTIKLCMNVGMCCKHLILISFTLENVQAVRHVCGSVLFDGVVFCDCITVHNYKNMHIRLWRQFYIKIIFAAKWCLFMKAACGSKSTNRLSRVLVCCAAWRPVPSGVNSSNGRMHLFGGTACAQIANKTPIELAWRASSKSRGGGRRTPGPDERVATSRDPIYLSVSLLTCSGEHTSSIGVFVATNALTWNIFYCRAFCFAVM